MNHLQAVILQGINRLNGERTISSIYHLLTGKKSSQTIQDAHLFQLTPLFKIFPYLKREEFEVEINMLAEKYSYIYVDKETNSCMATHKGQDALHSFFTERPFPKHIDGWKYQDGAILFWARLTLLVQVSSFLNQRENRYYPVQKDEKVLRWMREFLMHSRITRSNLSKKLFLELQSMFTDPFPEQPLMIVLRFSGYGRIGLTNVQAARRLNMERFEYDLLFTNAIHYMIKSAIYNKADYPILYALISDIYKPLPFTHSTRITYNLLKKNYSIEQIAQARNLKKSTIEDHMIEIALIDDTFSIDPFVDDELAKEITAAANQLGKRKLKPIKEQVKHATYFQIRLVLAKAGG